MKFVFVLFCLKLVSVGPNMASTSRNEVMMEYKDQMHVERNIANEIMETVRRLELPHKLDQLTEGRGNCFPIAIVQQCRRPEILSQLSPIVRKLAKHHQGHSTLRNVVKQFIYKSKLPNVARFKARYEENVATATGETWCQYWIKMIRDQVWVDYIFIQATAWYLQMDIWIVDTGCTEESPYIRISGNIMDESIACNSPTITIGSKSNSHYQSLLPVEMFHLEFNRSQHQPDNAVNLTMNVRNEVPAETETSEKIEEKHPERNTERSVYHSDSKETLASNTTN